MRNEYQLDLFLPWPQNSIDKSSPLVFRAPQITDADELAELMLAAYCGTIDDDGETLEDARNEIRAYLASERGGKPRLQESCIAIAGTRLAGACLVSDWDERQCPLIAYVMTDPSWKNQGVARLLLTAALGALAARGEHAVHAVITAGNSPSERLFARMGFRQVETA